MPTGIYERMPRARTPEIRFWSFVDKNGKQHETLGRCWEWTGGLSSRKSRGYGRFHYGGRDINAHIVSYEWTKGDIQEGLELDHLCRNTVCVNPNHLEAVTHRENVLRGTSCVAKQFNKIKCIRGHDLPKSNGKERVCRPCANIRNKKYEDRIKNDRISV